MHIVSLLPSTTEIAFALGLGESVVAITHECDYPPEARERPVITSSALDQHQASSEEIDAAVREQLRDALSMPALSCLIAPAGRPCRPFAPAGSTPWTAIVTLVALGRALSTASSCSPHSSTPTTLPAGALSTARDDAR